MSFSTPARWGSSAARAACPPMAPGWPSSSKSRRREARRPARSSPASSCLAWARGQRPSRSRPPIMPPPSRCGQPEAGWPITTTRFRPMLFGRNPAPARRRIATCPTPSAITANGRRTVRRLFSRRWFSLPIRRRVMTSRLSSSAISTASMSAPVRFSTSPERKESLWKTPDRRIRPTGTGWRSRASISIQAAGPSAASCGGCGPTD